MPSNCPDVQELNIHIYHDGTKPIYNGRNLAINDILKPFPVFLNKWRYKSWRWVLGIPGPSPMSSNFGHCLPRRMTKNKVFQRQITISIN